MEQNFLTQLKPLCVCLQLLGLAPFYFDENNDIIYSTFYIKIMFVLEVLVILTNTAIVSIGNFKQESQVSKVLACILLGVFILKVVLRNVKGLFYSKSVFNMWIRAKETIEMCNKQKIRYNNSVLAYSAIAALILAILVPVIFNSVVYIKGNMTSNNFICLSCVYIVNMPYLAATQEFHCLITWMSEYYNKLNLTIKELTNCPKTIELKEDTMITVTEMLKCYFATYKAVEDIARNFALPIVLCIGEIIMILLIHSHNMMLSIYGKDRSVLFIFNVEFTIIWAISYMLFVSRVCFTAYHCQKQVSTCLFLLLG